MADVDVTPYITPDESFPVDAHFPMQELNLLVDEDDEEGALQAIAAHSCAFRHPARLAHIYGMAAAAEKAGFHASFEAFKRAVEVLPNAPEPEVRCAFVSQLVPLAAAWDKDGGAEGHPEVLKLMQTALDSLEDDVEEVTTAGQAAVLGIARLLGPGDLRVHVLSVLDALAQHREDEVRGIVAEMVAALAADVEGIAVEPDLLPRLLELAADSAYLEVVFGLPRVAPRLSQQLVESQLLPVYRKLAADRVWLVRAAAASTLPAIAGFLAAGTARAALVDVWQELAGDASKWALSAALTSLGPFLAQLAPESITDGLLQQLCRAVQEGAAGTDCLMAAAGALPAVAEAVGPGRWAALQPVLSALVASGNREALHSLARDLPRLARALGPHRATSDWLPALEDIKRQGGAEALAGLAPQLALFAALLPVEQCAEVLQPLVAALRGSASWRVRCELTGQLSQLARCSPVQVAEETLAPSAVLLCQDPVAAVRHAAAAECAAMAAHLFSLVNAAGSADLSGPAVSASTAGAAPVTPAAPSTTAAAEAGSTSAAGQREVPTAGDREAAREALVSAEGDREAPAEEPGEGQLRAVLSSLLRQLESDLARSRSFRSRHSFVLVCQHILGLHALELFQQELLPELLKLAADPVVDVRLALCRLLLQDSGPLSDAMSAAAERSAVCQPESSAAADSSDEAGKDDGVSAAASAAGSWPSNAANASQPSTGGIEQRGASGPGSHQSDPGEADGCRAGAETQSSGYQQGSASRAELSDSADVTAWLLKKPEVRRALELLAKDVNSQVSLLADRGILRDKGA